MPILLLCPGRWANGPRSRPRESSLRFMTMPAMILQWSTWMKSSMLWACRLYYASSSYHGKVVPGSPGWVPAGTRTDCVGHLWSTRKASGLRGACLARGHAKKRKAIIASTSFDAIAKILNLMQGRLLFKSKHSNFASSGYEEVKWCKISATGAMLGVRM